MKIHEDIIQMSEEWYALKLGKVSGSSFSKAIGKPGSTRNTYMRKLMAERITGQRKASYCSDEMKWGIVTEPQAAEYHEWLNNVKIKHVGFVEHSEFIGVSPDGFIGEDGLFEAKCPDSSTHIQYMLDNKMPSTYVAQVQGQLWVTGRKWCDFVSFDPRNKNMPYWCIRVERDEKKIAEIEVKVNKFVDEMNVLIEKITAKPF